MFNGAPDFVDYPDFSRMYASPFLHFLFALSFVTPVILYDPPSPSAGRPGTVETEDERKLKKSEMPQLTSAASRQDTDGPQAEITEARTRVKMEQASALLERLSDVLDSMTGEEEYESYDDNPKDPSLLHEFPADMLARKARIESCLQTYYAHPVNADVLRPWSIMHGVLAYGNQSMVVTRGKRVNAIDYLCHNGVGNDRRLLQLKDGKLSPVVGIGYQGHEGQLLAILAQVKTPLDHPIQVDGQSSFIVRDLVEYEMLTCRPGQELTFKLIGLSVYLPSDATWKDNTGQTWDISRLMYEELAQPINGAACGGIHRLMGLSYAVAVRKARGEPIDGQWKRAENFVARYQQHALTLQNPDGGFSTEFFEGLSNTPDPIRQIYTTGHLLEWLAFSMTEEELESTPLLRLVDRLLDLMQTEHGQQELSGTDVGPKGHALRALRLFELRIFGEPSNYRDLALADPRPIIEASEASALQKNVRVVLPTSASSPDRFHTTSPSLNSSNEAGNMRNTRFMRRR